MNPKNQPKEMLRPPSETEIRERAYQLYEQGGRVPGQDWENWLRAEAELMAERRDAAAAIPSKWKWHYRTLLQIRDALQAECAERETAVRAPLSQGEGDAMDVARDASEHEELLAEIAIEGAELAEVEAALERIRNGSYGICEVTGQPISAARLRAIPWTRHVASSEPPRSAGA